MNYIHEIFRKKDLSQEGLTTTETFSMEVIYALGNPTVNQFASFLNLTSPNAAYKVNHLVQKGFINKVQSEEDRRVYYLVPTQKYIDYYAIDRPYLNKIMNRTRKRVTKEEWATFKKVMGVLYDEQMKEQENCKYASPSGTSEEK